ncbi:hypothetical protein FNV43_RR10715 [Rhamnella rubrinervis]|uniref:Uncharacterized protein n=1 Tax=Rhamnella rubrinervis TaxID=2594499 RepID=A0A8K0H4L1_9ROSA|nr:hypothetical protein FNV43_RR10715 [Rhamnella rubrinervis]
MATFCISYMKPAKRKIHPTAGESLKMPLPDFALRPRISKGSGSPTKERDRALGTKTKSLTYILSEDSFLSTILAPRKKLPEQQEGGTLKRRTLTLIVRRNSRSLLRMPDIYMMRHQADKAGHSRPLAAKEGGREDLEITSGEDGRMKEMPSREPTGCPGLDLERAIPEEAMRLRRMKSRSGPNFRLYDGDGDQD